MFPIDFLRPTRIFGDEPTTYANRKAKLGLTSIAGQPHKHERAIARRQRQAERNLTRQVDRYNNELAELGAGFPSCCPPGTIGWTGRGNAVSAS